MANPIGDSFSNDASMLEPSLIALTRWSHAKIASGNAQANNPMSIMLFSSAQSNLKNGSSVERLSQSFF